MSKQNLVPVELYTDGESIKYKTDEKTAAAIELYNDVYKSVNDFTVKLEKSRFYEKVPKQIVIREQYVAKSEKYTIICSREYVQNPFHMVCGAEYRCSVRKKDGKFLSYTGYYIPMLYYRLFCGREK